MIPFALDGRRVRPEQNDVWQRLLCDGTWTVEDDKELSGFCISKKEMGIDTWEVEPEISHIWMSEQGTYLSHHKPDPETHFQQYKRYKLVLDEEK